MIRLRPKIIKMKYNITRKGKAVIKIGRANRNGVNTASLIRKYVVCFMYMYLCMYCVRKMERRTVRLGICYTMFITYQRSGLSDLIYKVIFEVFHHTKGSETLNTNNFH